MEEGVAAILQLVGIRSEEQLAVGACTPGYGGRRCAGVQLGQGGAQRIAAGGPADGVEGAGGGCGRDGGK